MENINEIYLAAGWIICVAIAIFIIVKWFLKEYPSDYLNTTDSTFKDFYVPKDES